MFSRYSHSWFAIWLTAMATLVGCGETAEVDASFRKSDLRPLGQAYGQFMSAHRGQPPKNREEFKAYLKKHWQSPQREASGDNAASLESLFLSPRDGQEMMLVYGKSLGEPGPVGMPYIAYEKKPTRGKRLVVSASGAVFEMDAQGFQRVFPKVEQATDDT